MKSFCTTGPVTIRVNGKVIGTIAPLMSQIFPRKAGLTFFRTKKQFLEAHGQYLVGKGFDLYRPMQWYWTKTTVRVSQEPTPLPDIADLLPGVQKRDREGLGVLCDKLEEAGHPLAPRLRKVQGNGVTLATADDDFWDQVFKLLGLPIAREVTFPVQSGAELRRWKSEQEAHRTRLGLPERVSGIPVIVQD